MKLLLCLLIGISLQCFTFAQDALHFLTYKVSDTIISRGDEYTLMHFHVVSDSIGKRILFEENDSIFNDEYNKFSRLVFHDRFSSFDIPTIPLNNIIYLKEKKIIIGLSKISISPYQIVIYTDKGELLFKGFNPFSLRLGLSQLEELILKYPGIRSCLEHLVVVKDKDDYLFDLSKCIINRIGRDSLLKLNGVILNPYFPGMSTATDQQFYNTKLYSSFYADGDPLYDLIMSGSIPFLLILNAENGEKVNIPLVSNCNIINQLEKSADKKILSGRIGIYHYNSSKNCSAVDGTQLYTSIENKIVIRSAKMRNSLKHINLESDSIHIKKINDSVFSLKPLYPNIMINLSFTDMRNHSILDIIKVYCIDPFSFSFNVNTVDPYYWKEIIRQMKIISLKPLRQGCLKYLDNYKLISFELGLSREGNMLLKSSFKGDEQLTDEFKNSILRIAESGDQLIMKNLIIKTDKNELLKFPSYELLYFQ